MGGKKLKKFLLAGLSVLFLMGCSSKETNDDGGNSVTKQEGKEVKEEKGVYFKDGEVKLEDLKIKITDTKVIQPGEKGNEYSDKPIFAIWYDTTNLSDKEINPGIAWMVVFQAIQDNNPNSVNEINVGGLPDEQFMDSQFEVIKKDGTVSNAVAYELDDLETPVKLIATQGVGGKKLGEQEFDVK